MPRSFVGCWLPTLLLSCCLPWPCWVWLLPCLPWPSWRGVFWFGLPMLEPRFGLLGLFGIVFSTPLLTNVRLLSAGTVCNPEHKQGVIHPRIHRAIASHACIP